MVDTPVVVGTLADREDLILQGVGVVADDTELDIDTGGHLVLLVWVCLLLNLKNGRSVLPFCGSSLLTEIGQNHHEEFQEVAALGGVRRANVLAELLNVLTVFVKLNAFHDFIHPLAEYGIVDVQVVVINKLVCEDLGKGLEFSQPLFWRRQRRELCVGLSRHNVDGEMVEGGEKRVHIRFVLFVREALPFLAFSPIRFCSYASILTIHTVAAADPCAAKYVRASADGIFPASHDHTVSAGLKCAADIFPITPIARARAAIK